MKADTKRSGVKKRWGRSQMKERGGNKGGKESSHLSVSSLTFVDTLLELDVKGTYTESHDDFLVF